VQGLVCVHAWAGGRTGAAFAWNHLSHQLMGAAEVDKQFQTLLAVYKTEIRAEIIRRRRAKGQPIPDRKAIEVIMVRTCVAVYLEVYE